MRKQSPRRQQRASYPTSRQLKERSDWSLAFDSCWICGSRFDLQTHEIASKAQAPFKWATTENYFRTCSRCNQYVLNNLPEAVQLAYKKHFDPDNYNRVFINQLRGEADNSISESEVNVWNDYVKAVSK
jgi:5-methylcytosine-specific restriction endonuclease McrA